MDRVQRFKETLLLMSMCVVSTVTCQDTVHGYVGDDVLLPCIYSEGRPLEQTVSVFWRDKDSNSVLDIINNQPDLSTQNQKFRGRVSSFPVKYTNGNFSIQLKDVQVMDNSLYRCHIPLLVFQQRVFLNVSDRRDGPVTAPPGPSDGAVVTLSSLHLTLISLLWSLLFC